MAEYKQAPSGTRDGHIQAPPIRQETDALVEVRADRAQQHDFAFSALEAVDGGHLHQGILRQAPLLELARDDADLGGVGAEDDDVLGPDFACAIFQHADHLVDHRRRLLVVDPRDTVAASLLRGPCNGYELQRGP
eukprot:CAMPEP_0204159352 /NCGR_PEP_ID=MMETSP0361-20130328/32935_1 /ASSEMBLY_ACC=CAM_ASM_000343 /TAXON_ID=268821 /ORGANISM="Scrippsiella Hangoei, Strain SHTV-5" /LENGTH=134 /DNA_ID=CAMNT_0051115465 /DNA_START=227 /DNA_END=628 /DNA_ORIENTATION=-